jgi:hypothetical protein
VKILFDIVSCGWGDASWITGHMAWHAKQGHQVYILTQNWGQPSRSDYDACNPEKAGWRPDKPIGAKLFNPNKEPIDYYVNILQPSIGCHFFDLASNRGTISLDELKRQAFDKILEINGPSKLYRDHNFAISKEVSQFTYKITEELRNDAFNKIKDELSKTKNIVLCSTWDEKNIYERYPNRARGPFMGYTSSETDSRGKPSPADDCTKFKTEKTWSSMINCVKAIDNFCKKNADYRIVLCSKKAQDWPFFLESDFYDLRYFEKKGLSMSQFLQVLTETCQCTMSYLSTIQVLLNYSSSMNHIIWYPKYTYQEPVSPAMPTGSAELQGCLKHISYFLENPENITENEIKHAFGPNEEM